MLNRALIMAGGFGTRLHGLTKDTPKPMLRVGTSPLIEQLVRHFVDQEVCDIFISVHYKAGVIKEYFGDGSAFGASIEYIDEVEPLDTGGATKLMPEDAPFIVQNGDVIADVNYNDLMEKHNISSCGITACAALYQHQVPYGVFDIDAQGMLSDIREKPIINHFVNAGIYVVEPTLPKLVGADKFKMTDLINVAMDVAGVNIYPIDGYWIDIGSFETYDRAQQGR